MSDGSNKAGKWVCNGKPEHYKWPELLVDIATLNQVLSETLGLTEKIELEMPHKAGITLARKVENYITKRITEHEDFEPSKKFTPMARNVIDYFLTVARVNGNVEQDVLPTWQPKSICRCTFI